MGAPPKFLDYFVDQRQPISQWVGNSTWSADSASQSANAKGAMPVIALPMSSTAAGSLTSQQQFQAFASGQYDDVLKGIVQTWAQRGFTSMAFRPGWEMNIGGPTYAGDSAQSEADWVKAFQHISTVLHQAATANGVAVQVVWNPSVINYSNALATTNLYPGDAYVDVVGADMYSDIYPYSDGGATATYHDWNTGLADTSVAAFIADPVNRQHYWSYPAATVWQNDSSGGHSQSLTSFIDFAKLHNKPFALPETGAGNSNAGTDVSDDAAFPQWLSQQLAAAQAAGVKISFANIWDSNGGGNYQFSLPGDGKPAEAAAWATYLGVPQTTATVTLGYGPDTLALLVAEDAWQGDAQFTVAVDGKTLGGAQSVTALHSKGAVQDFGFDQTMAAGTHDVAVSFLNDAYGGSAATDRNLYVNAIDANGSAIPGTAATLLGTGTQHFSIVVAAHT
jgi:hypothetical protein